MRSCRSSYLGVAVFTALLNILYLTGSFFMLQVYDRVLPSRSVPTLVALCILALGLYGFQAVLDIVRNRVLVRIAGGFAETLDRRIYHLLVKLPLRAPQMNGFEPVRDLDQIRGFMSGPGPGALFDLPWMPLYLGICYLFHPLIGLTATVGALILVVITFITEVKVRKPSIEVSSLSSRRTSLAEASRRNSEVLHAMGMIGRFAHQWADYGRRYVDAHQRAGDITGGMGSFSRALRMALQSARAGGRCLPRDQWAGDRRHHHRRIDPVGPRAGAGRAGDRPMAGLRVGPPELASPQQSAQPASPKTVTSWRCPSPRRRWRSKPSAWRRRG